MSRIVSQLAARLELLSSSLLELIVVGPHRPVAQFRREPLVNGIYVVHAPHGAILLSGLMLESDDATLQATRADRIDALGAGGFASTYRVVDLGTPDLARQLGRIVFDLFGGAFPLSQDLPAEPAADITAAATAAVVPEAAPTFRKRSRPRKEEAPATAPVEAAIAAAVEPAIVAPAAKKRGRPSKNVPPPVVTPADDSLMARDDAGRDADQTATNGGATNGSSAPAEPSRTINSGSSAATLVDSNDIAVDSADPDHPADTTDSNGSNDGEANGGPMLQMTKNQRREKRRRELALLLRGGEG
jgi:hypothetical protein